MGIYFWNGLRWNWPHIRDARWPICWWVQTSKLMWSGKIQHERHHFRKPVVCEHILRPPHDQPCDSDGRFATRICFYMAICSGTPRLYISTCSGTAPDYWTAAKISYNENEVGEEDSNNCFSPPRAGSLQTIMWARASEVVARPSKNNDGQGRSSVNNTSALSLLCFSLWMLSVLWGPSVRLLYLGFVKVRLGVPGLCPQFKIMYLAMLSHKDILLKWIVVGVARHSWWWFAYLLLATNLERDVVKKDPAWTTRLP